METGIGLDFGTTNSALALAGAGDVALVPLSPGAAAEAERATLRSLIYFDAEEKAPDRRPLALIGEDAIRAVLDPYQDGRLIQSVKSYLANTNFNQTRVFGRKYTIPDLIAVILSEIRMRGERAGAPKGARVMVGRPAKYVGAEEDALALERMREALGLAGFERCAFAYEPLAAAYAYERRLNHDELVLIGDFGGGTSDFCLLHVGPTRRAKRQAEAILAVDGVGRAGDALDARIVQHVVAPALGQGTDYTAPSGKRLPVPAWLYEHLQDWHRLSFLDTPDTRALLTELRAGADNGDAFAALEAVIAERLGYRLARAVEATKIALSSGDAARFEFAAGPVRIDRTIARKDFEVWIAPELQNIEDAVARTLSAGGAGAGDVDAVFLTGGTAFVPAVRNLFARRFGADKLKGGGELVSVATGLALMAAEAA